MHVKCPDTKNRKWIRSDNEYHYYELTVRKGDRVDMIEVQVPINEKIAKKENEDYWLYYQRQYLQDAAVDHRAKQMTPKQTKLKNKIEKMLKAGDLSRQEVLKMLTK